MEEENPNSKKRPLNLDWTQILDENDDESLPLLIVKTDYEPPKPSPMSIDLLPREDFASMTDRDIEESIKRQKTNISTLGPTLRDKGEKLRACVKDLEEELQRRKLRRTETVIDICEKSNQLMHSDGFKRQNASSEVHSQSEFASIFSRKMGDNQTDHKIAQPFDKQLSILDRCNSQLTRSNGTLSQWARRKGDSSSRQLPFKCASSLSHNGDKRGACNSDEKTRASSTFSFHHNWENSSHNFSKKKDNCAVLSSNGSRPRKGQTVVLVDEDETQPVDEDEHQRVDEDDAQLVEKSEPAYKLNESMKDAKIYYPSRDDPESVEICYMDLNCLAPEGFLTSPIMNFYIRYLQMQISPANMDYHFFNTFFYKKLRQAVSYKGRDGKSFFVKFRRWWKGVNIFQKAYIFIPIHEDLHWSLVIICIPDKEDESGPIILHLDSLGLHSSKSVFEDIRSYLREEWNYINQEVDLSDLPIADRIWKYLPRRIDEKKIEVPQQKNDYDCGLFVLFFMERFIEKAPERLKKKDLAMFGKHWFRPQEASGLRVKIRRLLLDKFQNADEGDRAAESSPLRSRVHYPGVDCADSSSSVRV